MKRNKLTSNSKFYPMLAINIIMAVLFIFFYARNLYQTQTDIRENNLQEIESAVTSSAEQFGAYMYNSDNMTEGFRTYMEGKHFSIASALDYLTYWADFYEKIELINVGTYSFFEVYPQKKMYVQGSRMGDPDVVDYITNLSSHESEDDVLVTRIFFMEGIDEPVIGVCRRIHIQQYDYLMLFVSRVSTLLNYGITVDNLSTEDLILMDGDGSILYGSLDGVNSSVSQNFYNTISLWSNGDVAYMAKDSINTTGQFNFEFTTAQNGASYFIGHKVPHCNDWVLVRRVDAKSLAPEKESVKLSVFATVFLMIWLLIDVIGYISYNQQLKKSLRTIEVQNEELAYASSAKTTFVSNISHEIRTPINAVLGMDEMILRESKDPIITSYAEDIHNAGNVLLNLINDVLDFSKIESGKLDIIPVDYSPASLVSDIYTLSKLKADAKYLNFSVNVASDLPSMLYGDDVRIKQIIINLLSNAIKYTTEGIVELTMGYERKSDAVISLNVAVKDSGIGIKPEDIDRLFDEYSRFDTKKNRNVEGTGLGMSIVCKLLNMMGSELQIDSTYGVGSRFSFSILQKVVDNTPTGFLDLDKVKEKSDASFHEQTIYAPDARILVVDDTPLNIKVVESLLKDSGMTIDTATSGARCLKATSMIDYDLVLLDHRMPKMDGVETLHILREREKETGRRTPVVVLTANVVSGAKEYYVSEGFDDFLSKPINPEYLDEILTQYLPPEKVSRKSLI